MTTNREKFQEKLRSKLLTQIERLEMLSDEEIAGYVGRITLNVHEELKIFAQTTDRNGDWHSTEKMAKWLKKGYKKKNDS